MLQLMMEGQFTFIQTSWVKWLQLFQLFKQSSHNSAVKQNPLHLDRISRYLPYSKQSEKSALPKRLYYWHSRPDFHLLIYYDECVYVVQGFAPRSLRLAWTALWTGICLSHRGSSGRRDTVRMTDGNQFPSQNRQIQSKLIRQLAQIHRPSTSSQTNLYITPHYRDPEGRITFIFSIEKYIFRDNV